MDNTENAGFVDARCILCQADKRCYRMIGYCLNCKAEPILALFSFEHKASWSVLGPKCPFCGMKELYWRRRATDDETPEAFGA